MSLSLNFFIGEINIDTIEGASCFNLGTNLPIGFKSYKKHSQGFGSISGNNNSIEDISSLLRDSSQIDIFDQMENDKIPDWAKELVAVKLQEHDNEI
ncbi:hypothetical protein [Sporohalobacter salinus]|uniref:hypothetical protein n=1 Tax=Sporohalobacter salinus TaxID=1494606 RepID=UPI001960AD4E|nr:hypothetical protein [Sporohalobacter salinus]MBM7624452.1 hypothetical protein [Sporohalobacter salinus]